MKKRTNNRQAGKRWERYFANDLKSIFPDVKRNANEQSQMGGLDLKNTAPFGFEIKGGKQCNIVKIDNWLEQLNTELKQAGIKYGAVLCKPSRKEPFVILSYKQYIELIEGIEV